MILTREHHGRFFAFTVLYFLCQWTPEYSWFQLPWYQFHTPVTKKTSLIFPHIFHNIPQERGLGFRSADTYLCSGKVSCHRIPNPSWIVSLLFPAKEITICKGTLSKGRREFTVICKLHLRRTENLRQHKANSRVSCQNRATFNIHVSIQDASLHNVYCSHQIHMFST